MKKKQPQKEPLSPIVKIAIGVGVFLVLGVLVLGINSVRTQKQIEQRQAEQASQLLIRKRKEQPKFKNFDSTNTSSDINSPKLSKQEAISAMQADIKYGFKLIKDTNAISGSQITRKQLSPSQNKQVVKHFNSISTFNDFNNAVNISTPSGANYYGQNGKEKTIKTSKQGDYYVVAGGKVEFNDSAYNNYIYDVNLSYKAGNFKNRIWLKISVDRTTGVITDIELEGQKDNG